MSETKLLPCPFCGGEAEVKMFVYLNYNSFVVCKKCNTKSSMYVSEILKESKQMAINAWNTRKPVERIIERLEEMRKVTDVPTIHSYCNTTISKAIEIIKEEVQHD